MNVLKRYKNMQPLFWFTAALLLFLSIGIVILISGQRSMLLNQVNIHMDHEFHLLEAAITSDLSRQRFPELRSRLSVFATQHDDILAIKVIDPAGTVRLEYARPIIAPVPFTRSYRIEQPGRPSFLLELTHDLAPLQQELAALSKKHILASFLFAAAMAVFLWYVLRKKAFIPLEAALSELNRVNAGLEQQVTSRTMEWMRANMNLRNEIEERRRSESRSRKERDRTGAAPGWVSPSPTGSLPRTTAESASLRLPAQARLLP